MSVLVLTEPFDNLSAWTLGSGGTIVAGGQVGTMFHLLGSSARGYPIPAGSESDDYDVEFWWKTTSLVGNFFIVQFRGPGALNNATLQVLGDGSLRVRAGGVATGVVLGSTPAGTVVPNTWYRLRLVIKLSSYGTAVLYVDGVKLMDVTTVLTYLSTRFPTELYLGGGGTSDSNDFDELVLRTAVRVMVWNGSRWSNEPVSVWNGSFVEALDVRQWNGSGWVK